MVVLGLDTCDAGGSVCVLHGEDVASQICHTAGEEYSSWLIPATEECLRKAGVGNRDVELYAVAVGPGSFTGVRVGLATVKAWAEVFERPIAAVSRLEAVAMQSRGFTGYVAAVMNAQRGHVYGAVYRRDSGGLTRLGEEMASAPEEFLKIAADLSQGERIAWASADPECLLGTAGWGAREKLNDCFEADSGVLAPVIARMGVLAWKAGRVTDALGLNGSYVQRPAAERFWKGTGPIVRTMRPGDAEKVTRIANASPEAAVWTADSYSELEQNRYSGWVVELGGELAGFLIARAVGPEAEILNLAVASEARRRGNGRSLLRVAIRELAGRGVKKLFLEVRESNRSAIVFYTKEGFQATGRREGYYQNPPEAAVCMERGVTGAM